MEFFKTVIKYLLLGTVQGLCEFLPVSSSGHLVLLQHALGLNRSGGGMTFLNLMLHFGTLISVVAVFHREIAALFRRPFKPLIMLFAATVPAALSGILFEEKIDALFAGEGGVFCLSLCFAATAAMLLLCEIVVRRRKRIRPLSWAQTSAMGVMQAVAILPGISRSGSTIAAGTLAGARPDEAARFSFLMSVPVILGGFLLGVKDAALSPAIVFAGFGAAEIIGMILGVAAAAVSGYFAIGLVMKTLGRANYRYFALYLILLSVFSMTLSLLGIL